MSCIQHIQQIPAYKKQNQEPVLPQMSKHTIIWKYRAAAALLAKEFFFMGFSGNSQHFLLFDPPNVCMAKKPKLL